MKNALILICVAFVAFVGCRKDEIEGPELQDIFGEFDVFESLTADSETVNFENGEMITFSAQLSIRTDWVITVEGMTSGARYEIEGRERDIQGDVATWNGRITFAPLFSTEDVKTYMTFVNYPDTLWGDTITVEGVKPEALVDVLISDFSTGNGWGSFAEAAATNQQLTGSYFVQNPLNPEPDFIQVFSPEGEGHWRMTYLNNNSIFICGANILAEQSQQAETSPYFELGTTNPDNVYINMLIHGFGDGNTRMSIGLQEDDNLDGAYDRFTEGTYNTELVVDWVGWKVVSIPLSSFNISTVGGFGNIDGTGNQDIDRILSVEFLLLAAEGSTGFVGYGMDYCNFTRYTPWNP
ncbi:MAG: hypothetical protein P8H59_06545 [Flavobacteriales bacterium]|nr:hypothetical protein [Flavobacteriales bacterium]MDG1780589.1 hypothetical protein [Flavobacteriales bacterium]MDG2246382.1 hypothetical protein [Flavobacteriales bacterium]